MSVLGFIVSLTIVGAGIFSALGAPWWAGALWFFFSSVAGIAITEAGLWVFKRWLK